jgi:hypothetical protein
MYRTTAGVAAGHTSVLRGAVVEFLGKVGISGNGWPGWKGSDELSRDIVIAMGDPLLRCACDFWPQPIYYQKVYGRVDI